MEVVDDSLGEAAREVETVEVFGHSRCHGKIADGIESTIRAEEFFHPRVVVSNSSVVNLHRPSFCRIHHCQFVKKIGFVTQCFIRSHGTTSSCLGEDR